MPEGTARTSAFPNYLITERLRKHPAPVLTVVTQLRGASQQPSPSCHTFGAKLSHSTPSKGVRGGLGGLIKTAKRPEHKKSRLAPAFLCSRRDRLFCARDGNRTRTDIAAHRILSPACLPIPPLEPMIQTANVHIFSNSSSSIWKGRQQSLTLYVTNYKIP